MTARSGSSMRSARSAEFLNTTAGPECWSRRRSLEAEAFDDGAGGGEVAVEDDEGGGGVEGVREGPDDVLGEGESSEWGGVEDFS